MIDADARKETGQVGEQRLGARCKYWLSLGLGGCLSLGVLAPILVKGRDNFPFSTYPMFTSNRESVELMVILHAEDSASVVHGQRVPPTWIAGQEVMMATATIKRAVWGGPAAMTRLCEEVRAQAVRAKGRASEGEPGLGALGFVVETMNVKAYIHQEDAPHARRLHFLCPSPKGRL